MVIILPTLSTLFGVFQFGNLIVDFLTFLYSFSLKFCAETCGNVRYTPPSPGWNPFSYLSQVGETFTMQPPNCTSEGGNDEAL